MCQPKELLDANPCYVSMRMLVICYLSLSYYMYADDSSIQYTDKSLSSIECVPNLIQKYICKTIRKVVTSIQSK